MKGATRSTTADEVSTGLSEAKEARSETPESNASGLSRCWRSRFKRF